MNLSTEQLQDIANGQAVPVVVDGARCIVMREEVFDRVKRVVYDDMEPDEAYPTIVAAWDEEDDPGLAAYQDYKRQV